MRTSGNWRSAKALLSGSIICCFLLGLGGCTKYVWYHHDQKDPMNFLHDKSQCEDDVAQYQAAAGKAADKTAISNRMNDCMKARGYGWGPVGEAPDDSFVYEDTR
jgi:hypothetical protein